MDVEGAVVELLRRASTVLPDDVADALERARGSESRPVARTQLDNIIENHRLARERSLPMCQDTGVHVFWVIGCDDDVEEAIRAGVRRATSEVPLRPNAVDPITRHNPGDNVGEGIPVIHRLPGEGLEITVMPKGAGSENMSRMAMLNPADGMDGVMRFVLDAVTGAGGKPCPPTIVGVGVGGTSDECMAMAKRALLRPLDVEGHDPELASLESRLTEALNATGVGPMGLGGDTTVLGTRVERGHCHTASLPVAVCMQCWAARRATVRVTEEGHGFLEAPSWI